MNNATEEQQEEIEMLTTKKYFLYIYAWSLKKGKAASPYSPL